MTKSIVLALLMTGAVSAQIPPTFDALDQQLIEIAFEAYAVSQATCEAQSDTKHARRLSSYVEAMVTAKYPGHVIDWPNRRMLKK